jgi:glyoxylase-like metal-dependent hydrolase (beta-lactamase superfamily II)
VELLLEGDAPIRLEDDLTVIPTPGHTRGSACLLFKDRYLFSGDHLAYDPELGHPIGFRSACWYSWREQIRSMERLVSDYRFEWILPGHGHPCQFEADVMRRKMHECHEWMRGA